MITAHWQKCGKNFGDLLTVYWIEKLTGFKVERSEPKDAMVIGCGSILDAVLEGYDGILLGTGAMYDKPRPDLRNANVRAIRGPLTAELMGVDAPFGDMGLLFYHLKPRLAAMGAMKTVRALGHLPHYAVKTNQEGLPIDITSGVDEVLLNVARCGKLITSSLHGVILADALGIENMWIKDDAVCGDGFKFKDYGASLGEDIQPNVWRLGDQWKVAEMATQLRRIVIETIDCCVQQRRG